MILLNYGDLTIKGDSNLGDHEEWVQFDSVQWGVSRPIASTTGGGDRETSQPMFTDITLSKSMDKASIDLFIESCGGKTPFPAIIRWINTSGDANEVYHELELGNTLITSYTSSSGGDRPTDTITLNFTTINVKYTRFKPDGTQEVISPKGWDVAVNTKL